MKKTTKTFLNVCYITGLIILAAFAVENVSKRILIHKGLLPPSGKLQREVFDTRIDLWQGGRDNSSDYSFTGYNDSLKPDATIYQGQYGFINGDSADVTKDKPKGVIRIILTGGSGMRGNLQTWGKIKMFGYPEGTYDYPTSIAGKLKHILSVKYPSLKFEVINAAVAGHMFDQSYAAYYEKIHDFHPDIIINMDGYNDDGLAVALKEQGDPYLLNADQVNEGLEIEALRRSLKWGYTFMLLDYSALSQQSENENSQPDIATVIHDVSIADGIKMAKELKPDSVKSITIIPDSFRLIEPFIEKDMAKQFWLIASYENQLRHDSVYSIFCFQPILARKGYQKKLSHMEQCIYNRLYDDGLGDSPLPALAFDTVFMKMLQLPEDLRVAVSKMGNCKYHLKEYYHQYFINQYISPMTDSIVRSYGGAYVDIGKEMTALPESVEFYMDYTHTTPFGNEFIAEKMAVKVSEYLEVNHRQK